MELKWEYPLPTNVNSKDYQYESPILENGKYVYFVNESERWQKLHIVDIKTGTGCSRLLQKSVNVLPSNHFSFSYGNKVVIYAGDLHFIQSGEVLRTIDFAQKGEITSYILIHNRLYVSCSNGKNASLCCINLDKMIFVWDLDISNSKLYRAGEITLFDGLISCYGRDQLLLICPDSGKIVNALKISRIDKLFCPIRLDNDTMLIGYSNWTNAGILKYQISTKKVLWRHKRKFEGPQLKCKIYRSKDKAFWVKNSTELICVDIESGEELHQLRTTPWLYTDLQFYQDNILYGTAGADGYLNCLDCETFRFRWSAFLKNGCAYYGICNDSIVTGDFDKTIKQFSICDGRLINEMPVDGEVVGRITISEGYLYTVIWGNSEKDIRLVKIQIS